MSFMNSKSYWLAIRNNNVRYILKDSGYDLSARFVFGKIPRTISVNWMLPK